MLTQAWVKTGYKPEKLFEILDRPNFTVIGDINTACDFSVIGIGHIDVVTVCIKVISRTFIPHLLQTTIYDAGLRPPFRAFVLGPSPRRTNVIYEPGMGTVGGIVLGVFVRTVFPIRPAIKGGQALTVPSELVYSRNAIGLEISAVRSGSWGTVSDGLREWTICTFRIIVGIIT